MRWWQRLLGREYREEAEVQQAIEKRDELFADLDEAIKDVDELNKSVRQRVLSLEAEVRGRRRTRTS